MFSKFFQQQLDYFSFFDGLALFLLAVVYVLMRRQYVTPLPWIWLGLFGLIQGIHTWLDLLVPYFEEDTIFSFIRLIGMLLSFCFLMEFGRAGWIKLHGKGPGRWMYLPLLVCALFGMAGGMSGLNAAVRYEFALIGGLWSAAVLFRQSRNEKDKSRALMYASLGMMGYAIAEGLVVSPSSFFPASLIHDISFFEFTGIPISLIRGSLALLITCAIWAHDQRCKQQHMLDLDKMGGELRGRQFAFLLAIILILGWIFTENIGKNADHSIRNEILDQTKIASAAIQPKQIQRLTLTLSDLTSPEYQSLREQLMAMENAGTGIRWLYLMTLKDRNIVFAVDSVVEGQFGHENPGVVYKKPPQELFDVFAGGNPLAVGPYRDEYGSFISGFVAIRDSVTGQVMGVLGIDIDASLWQKNIAQHRLMPISLTLLIALLCMGFIVIRQRFWESSQWIAISEKRLTEAQRIARVGNWTYNLKTEEFIPSLELFHALGLNLQHPVLSFFEYQQCIAPEDRPKWNAALQKTMTTGQGFELELRMIRSDGSQSDIMSRVQAKRGRNGEVVQLVGTSQDLFERKRTENQLAETLDLNQKMIAASAVGILTYKAAGQCVLANKTAARMVNASISQLLAMNFRHIESWRVCGLLHMAETTLETKVTQYDEFHFVTTFGKEVQLECHMTPFTSHGELHLLLLMNDITERKQMEKALRESEERFRQVAESAGEWIWEVDAKGLYTYSSSMVEEILGFKPDEIVGKKHCYDFFDPEIGEELRKDILEKFAATEVVERIVAQLRWSEGGLLDYYASSEQVGAGRPSPAMILDAMRKLGVDDPRAVVKIGDTVMDVWRARTLASGRWRCSRARRRASNSPPPGRMPSWRAYANCPVGWNGPDSPADS